MDKSKAKKFNRFRLYFVLVIALVIVAFFSIISLSVSAEKVALDREEEKFHLVDGVYVANFLRAKESDDISSNISFGEDSDCYVAIIDSEGEAIAFNSGKNSGTSTSNVFKYLNTSKLTGISYPDAVSNILGSNLGRFEFSSNSQSKILIYTPIIEGEYAVVRIMPKKFMIDSAETSCELIDRTCMIQVVLFILMIILLIHLMSYTKKVEDSYARHTLIAADNELVSFTYHSSIASFEMTGAVASVFGEEIGKRGQIDWNTLSRLLHPDDQMMLRNISKAIKKGDTKYTTEFRLIDSEGNYHWYRLNGKCVQKDSGEATRFVGTIQNSDDQISHENMLKNKAEHDLLTGLLNKITIQEAVDAAILNASYSVYAFYIIDLDNFKAVNDNLGHATGDKVLTDVAGKLQLVFNEADYIGRLGGDEFAVLLVIPSMMTSQAEKLIREKAKLLNEILRAKYGDENLEISVSASIGIAMYPSDGENFSSLYQNADRALYHSKENGKDQFTFFTEVE